MSTELKPETSHEAVATLMNTVMSREVTQPEMFAKILQLLQIVADELVDVRAKLYYLDARIGDNIKNDALRALRKMEREKDEGPTVKPKRGAPRGLTYSPAQKARMYRAKYDKETPEERIKAQEKVCCTCNTMLPFSEYFINRRMADGKDSKCKSCSLKYQSKRRFKRSV